MKSDKDLADELPADWGKIDAEPDPNFVPLDFNKGLPDDIDDLMRDFSPLTPAQNNSTPATQP